MSSIPTVGVPSPVPATVPAKQVSPTNPKWQDLWCAILFYLHLAWFATCSLYAIRASYKHLFVIKKHLDLPDGLLGFLIAQLVGMVFTSGLLTAISMLMLRTRAEMMIHVSMIANIVLTALFGVLAAILRPNIFGYMACGTFLFIAVMLTIVYFWVRSRFAFSALILKQVMDCIEMYPSIYTVVAGVLVVSIVYASWFSVTFSAAAALYNEYDDALHGALLFFVLFSFLWSSQVLANVLQTTIAGVFATHYFTPRGQRADKATSGAFSRAVTYSFGSVCLGSLIVALIQLLRIVLKSATEKNSIAGAVVDCILEWVESLVAYFNYYAYTQIAIYGKSFVQASRDTWELIKRHGVDAIVNDNLTGTTTSMLSLAIGFCCGFVSFLLSYLIYRETMGLSVLLSLSMFLLGMLIPMVALQVIGAGSTALFVCLSEDPASLQRNDPMLYNKIVSKYGQFQA
ncbi:Choline transporter-like domain-containing protein [Paramicrosporidium saccamoebae]|uniref:Protein PNS1 n=1 Tax=Paramicrosporidium saccamoebae TaxID=1246581 RepID=A0A2H9TI77_9FUNG|nr:Choline transporter-like domain-containing protein [Paramicrosporidium saccamoebae]